MICIVVVGAAAVPSVDNIGEGDDDEKVTSLLLVSDEGIIASATADVAQHDDRQLAKAAKAKGNKKSLIQQLRANVQDLTRRLRASMQREDVLKGKLQDVERERDECKAERDSDNNDNSDGGGGGGGLFGSTADPPEDPPEGAACWQGYGGLSYCWTDSINIMPFDGLTTKLVWEEYSQMIACINGAGKCTGDNPVIERVCWQKNDGSTCWAPKGYSVHDGEYPDNWRPSFDLCISPHQCPLNTIHPGSCWKYCPRETCDNSSIDTDTCQDKWCWTAAGYRPVGCDWSDKFDCPLDVIYTVDDCT